MIHGMVIALACGSVAFACFGLSRVKLRRLSVTALLARAPKGMFLLLAGAFGWLQVHLCIGRVRNTDQSIREVSL